MGQPKRDGNSDFESKLITALQKYWKKVLALLGVSTLLDVLKEQMRGKAAEWLFTHLGGLGIYIVTYPLALLTLALVAAIVWLVFLALRESTSVYDSDILDVSGSPYVVSRIPKPWARSFFVGGLICALIILYGVAVYCTTVPLLIEFPLGYVTFYTNTLTGAVTPFETRKGLESFSFDFRNVRVIQNGQSQLGLQLPDVLKDNEPVWTGCMIGGDRASMEKFGAGCAFRERESGKGVMVTARVLQYRPAGGVEWIVGFKSAPEISSR